jgi:predicted amidophosphoribosyltransferase
MPTFKNKEEYQKWKAEQLQNQKSEKERIQKLREENEKLNRLWVCPECILSNDISQLKCDCGYVVYEPNLQYLKGSITSEELYKTISNERFINNNELASFLTQYLLKRFHGTEEARELSESQAPSLINCPTCKNEISKNAQFCPKCGEPLSLPARPRQRLWSPGVAALLSFILPGAGQIYKGELLGGMGYLFSIAILWLGGWGIYINDSVVGLFMMILA